MEEKAPREEVVVSRAGLLERVSSTGGPPPDPAFPAPCQHLVTFCLGEEDGVHTVEDASRKLAVMDSQGRVWVQEMLLRVSPDQVTLLDPVSKVQPGAPGDVGV